jgi:hypothetical protein
LTKEAIDNMSPEMRKDIIDTMANKFKNTTTTQQAGKEAAMPCTKVSDRPGLVTVSA